MVCQEGWYRLLKTVSCVVLQWRATTWSSRCTQQGGLIKWSWISLERSQRLGAEHNPLIDCISERSDIICSLIGADSAIIIASLIYMYKYISRIYIYIHIWIRMFDIYIYHFFFRAFHSSSILFSFLINNIVCSISLLTYKYSLLS